MQVMCECHAHHGAIYKRVPDGRLFDVAHVDEAAMMARSFPPDKDVNRLSRGLAIGEHPGADWEPRRTTSVGFRISADPEILAGIYLLSGVVARSSTIQRAARRSRCRTVLSAGNDTLNYAGEQLTDIPHLIRHQYESQL